MNEENGDTGVTVTLRLADMSRKMNIEVFRDESVQEFITEAREQWSLAGDVAYKLLNTRTEEYFSEVDYFTEKLVQEGDILELQPDVWAGGHCD